LGVLRWLVPTLPLFLACSADAKPTGGGVVDAGPAGAADASPSPTATATNPIPLPLRCSDAELAANDKTDGGALEIVFNTLADPIPYSNRCSTVKVGATVVFAGSFKQHPLEPAGGDVPSPIPQVSADTPDMRLRVPMTSAGTFGFECDFHPNQMNGAIRVVP
jgi:hypothetical protein